MVVQSPLNDKAVKRAFDKLNQTDKDAFLQLHEGSKPYKSKLARIYQANAFRDNGCFYLHLDISRINHSCLPNAAISRGRNPELPSTCVELIADKHIAKGEEISISYIHDCEYMTTLDRAEVLGDSFHFWCSCTTCSLDTEPRMISDARRLLIGTMETRLVAGVRDRINRFEIRLSKSIDPVGDAPMVDDDYSFQEISLIQSEATVHLLLCAHLREAEGFNKRSIAWAYVLAARYLVEQLADLDSIFVLDSIRHMHSWMQKAVDAVHGVHQASIKDRNKVWQQFAELQEHPYMLTAATIVSNVFRPRE